MLVHAGRNRWNGASYTFTPPPTGGALSATGFSLKSASTQTSAPFCVGMVFKDGDVLGSIAANLTNYRVVELCRWKSGYLKHALVIGQASLTANTPFAVTVTNGTPPSGGVAMTAANIATAFGSVGTTSVAIAGFGTLDLSTLLASPVRTYLATPHMVECHYRGQIGSSQADGLMEVRLWADGRMRIYVSLENGPYLDNGSGGASGAVLSTGATTITINGNVVFTNSGPAFQPHRAVSGEVWVGTDPAVDVTYDAAYLRKTKLAPSYNWTSPSSGALNALVQTYVQFDRAGWSANMQSEGYQPQIGILPLWDALAITSGDPRAVKASQVASLSLRSYSTVWRDKTTKKAPRPSDFATWGLDGPGQGGYEDYGAALIWNGPHHGSAGYVAYMLTGEYRHYETMAMQAAMTYLTVGSARGSGVNRVLRGAQTRTIAWTRRTIGQFCAIAPTGDTIAADYRTLLENDTAYWASQGPDNVSAAPLGYPIVINQYGDTSETVGKLQTAPWMHHFWMGCEAHVLDIEPGFTSTAHQTAFLDWMLKGIVGIVNTFRGHASCYTVTLSDDTYKPSDFPVVTPDHLYSTWTRVLSETFPGVDVSANSLWGSSGGDPANGYFGYWGNLLPALAAAVDRGISGALAALTFVTGATNWPTLRDCGFNDVPVWGVMPRSYGSGLSLPAWNTSMGAGEVKQLVGSAYSNYPPTNAPYGAQPRNGIIDAWGCLAADKIRNRAYNPGGNGHTDGSVNCVSYLDLYSLAWVEQFAGSTINPYPSDSARYTDGLPASTHGFYRHQCSGDRVIRVGTGSVASSGNPKIESQGFDLTVANGTNGWDAAGTWPDMGGQTGGADCSTCVDENGDILIFFSNLAVQKLVVSTKTRSSSLNTVSPPHSFYECAVGYDTTRRKALLLGGNVGNICTLFDVASGTFADLTLTGSYAAAILAFGKGQGLCYFAAIDRYVVRLGESGPNFYSIHPTTGATALLNTSFTGTTAIPDRSQAATGSVGTHPYGKLLPFPDYKGVLYVPAYASDAYFLKLVA